MPDDRSRTTEDSVSNRNTAPWHDAAVHRRSLILVASLLTVAGCAHSMPDTSKVAPPAPTSAAPNPAISSSAEASAVGPDLADPVVAVLPPAARANTRDGAIAFARFYVTQFGAMFAGKEVIDLRGLATTKCKDCAEIVEATEQLRKRGITRSNPARITYAGIEFPKQNGHVLQVLWAMSPLRTYDPSGAQTGSIVSSSWVAHMDVEYHGRWVVTSITLFKDPRS
jgi:hypothetical protein